MLEKTNFAFFAPDYIKTIIKNKLRVTIIPKRDIKNSSLILEEGKNLKNPKLLTKYDVCVCEEKTINFCNSMD